MQVDGSEVDKIHYCRVSEKSIVRPEAFAFHIKVLSHLRASGFLLKENKSKSFPHTSRRLVTMLECLYDRAYASPLKRNNFLHEAYLFVRISH